MVLLVLKQVDCVIGDIQNSCHWQQRVMFWVTWQNAHEHIPLRFVAQFFPRTSQLLIFVVSTTWYG